MSILHMPFDRLVFDLEFEDAPDLIIFSEFMPMSDDHVPLPGDTDFVPLSEEDMAKLFAAHQSGETSPEVRAQLDALFEESDELMRSIINEDMLAGPADAHVDKTNYDELPATQQGTWADSQNVQNPQMFKSFPTLKNFTVPVAGLPQLPHIDQGLYYPSQPSAVPQAPPQDHPWPQREYNPGYFTNELPGTYTQPSVAPQDPVWSQHGYNLGYDANGPPGAYYLQPSAIVSAPPHHHAWPQNEYNPGYHANGPPSAYCLQPSAIVPAPLQGHAFAQHGYHLAPSYSYQQLPTIAGPSNAHYPSAPLPQGQYAPLQTESSGGSSVEPTSFVLDWTASTKPRKRKTRQTSNLEDGLSSSVPPTTRKRRRPNVADDYRPGKFGPYMLADASATIMTMPVHDPKPVNISSRRTHDPNGNSLRTRRFGAMELDDTYPDASGNVHDHHWPQLTCVRSCDWTDQPCGLFIEVDKIRIEDHLWFWHGVEAKKPTPCQFEGCPDAGPMMYLSRHIEGVHFATSYRCAYCKKLSSRTDSLARHQKGCKQLLASRAHAEHWKYEFSLQAMIKSISGYIVPAKNAT
ncbi:uncharacterized protein F5147DRAFT_799130 [Suillus discolor]|uniref:Uncharacterized protein n=1 Tax=Suillus discolor TaxID=1912936 RepID=A0A9P7JU54_9AGAM|nr:uncharacterized protein F5147DRAFT_799130 [Suillus discolor]KAG2109060.1 hypothetical protein F5147DRAFT_799130 [Suillus discolor]